MTQDITLLRDIMLFVEEQPPATSIHSGELAERFPDLEELFIAEHVLQLKNEGLIEGFAKIWEREKTSKIRIERITASGHEFIRAVKNDSIWRKAQKFAVEQGTALTLALLLHFLKTTVE